MKFIQLLIFALLSFSCNKPSPGPEELYHRIESGAAEYYIAEWNIGTPSKDYAIEKTDSLGRAISLEFFLNDTASHQKFPLLPSRIEYSYYPDSLVESFFTDGPMLAEYPSKIIYSLDEEGIIISCVRHFSFDESWTPSSKSQFMERANVDYCPFVTFFSKSLRKMNGEFPVTRDFKRSRYFFSEVEDQMIEKALQK